MPQQMKARAIALIAAFRERGCDSLFTVTRRLPDTRIDDAASGRLQHMAAVIADVLQLAEHMRHRRGHCGMYGASLRHKLFRTLAFQSHRSMPSLLVEGVDLMLAKHK